MRFGGCRRARRCQELPAFLQLLPNKILPGCAAENFYLPVESSTESALLFSAMACVLKRSAFAYRQDAPLENSHA
jgi:hypothetical protein